MRVILSLIVCVLSLSVMGCEKKSGMEQLQSDMKKAGNQMAKDVDSMMK